MPPPFDAQTSAEAAKKKAKSEGFTEDDRRAFASASSELLFVLLPFIVIGITLAHRGEFRTILLIPEWSIVSAVIVGQTIVKLTSAGIGKTNVKKEAVILIISILLVCLLVPILIILAIALTSPQISMSLAIIQAALFFLSAALFWTVSALITLPR